MRLVLIEQNEAEGYSSRREIKIGEGKVTIGRKGAAIVPVIAAEAISRTHASVSATDSGWVIEDGDGSTPSRNGLYDRHGSRISRSTEISRAGDYVDLIPVRSGVMSRLLVEDDSLKSFDSSRETKGFEYVASSEFQEDIQEIKGRLIVLEGEVLMLKKVNVTQDEMIKRSRSLLLAFGVLTVVILTAAIGNKEHREQLISVAAAIVLSIGTTYGIMAVPPAKKE